MKKFAFIIMGSHYQPEIHHAEFATKQSVTYIFTVRNFEEAKQRTLSCKEDGVGVIELCGAFGEEMARELIRLTEDTMGIGFSIHLSEQNQLFDEFFKS
jgi:hypothetical protein